MAAAEPVGDLPNLQPGGAEVVPPAAVPPQIQTRQHLNPELQLTRSPPILKLTTQAYSSLLNLTRQNEVNASFGLPTAYDEALNVEPPARSLPAQSLENKLDQIIDMLTGRGTQGQSNATPYPPSAHDSDYYYTENEPSSAGLDDFETDYDDYHYTENEPSSAGLDDFETYYDGPTIYPDQELDTPLDWTLPTWY